MMQDEQFHKAGALRARIATTKWWHGGISNSGITESRGRGIAITSGCDGEINASDHFVSLVKVLIRCETDLRECMNIFISSWPCHRLRLITPSDEMATDVEHQAGHGKRVRRRSGEPEIIALIGGRHCSRVSKRANPISVQQTDRHMQGDG
jgi:hypothetical protein